MIEHHLSHAASALPGLALHARRRIAHGRRRRRVVDGDLRPRRRQRHRALQGDPLPALARPALHRVHVLSRLQGEQRRVQGDGTRALRARRSTIDEVRELIDVAEDGSFQLNMEYFAYHYGLTHDQRPLRRALRRQAARSPRRRSSSATRTSPRASRRSPRRSMLQDGAASASRDRPARTCAWRAAWRSTASPTAASCARGRSSDIFVQPAAGDAGGALGVAAYLHHTRPRHSRATSCMRHAFLGPAYATDEIRAFLDGEGRPSSRSSSATALLDATARGDRRPGGHRLVPGPHGVRSARARRAQHPGRRAQSREPGPRQPEDQVPRELPALRAVGAGASARASASSWIARARSCCSSRRRATDSAQLPAITHVDGSARVQTVDRETNPAVLRSAARRSTAATGVR